AVRQLALARNRRQAKGVGEILQLDRGIEPFEKAPVLRELCGHCRRVAIDGAPVRERMAGDLVTDAAKPYDAVRIDTVAMIGASVDQPARDVERAEPAELLEHRRADGGGAHGNVVESEAHHRLRAIELQRRGEQMPGEAAGEARSEVRQGRHHHFRDDAGSRASSRRKPSQLRKMVSAAAPAAMSERSVKPGSSAASRGSRLTRARRSKLSSCATVASSK